MYQKIYHDTGSEFFSAKHKGRLFSVAWKNVVSDHGAAMALNGESLVFVWFLSVLIILCLPDVSNKSYHDT